MAGYKYRGKQPLVPNEPAPDEAPKQKKAVQPCGTFSAYQMHLYRKEPACDACKRASRDKARERRAGNPDRRRVAKCGTTSGYQAHHRRNETPCAECRAAKAAYSRERYEQKKASKAKEGEIRAHPGNEA